MRLSGDRIERGCFSNFHPALLVAHDHYEQQIITQPRQRGIGGGRKAKLSSPQEKLFSSTIKERVLCENAFAGVKRYNVIAHIYSFRVPDFDDKLMLTACGLWNFYLIAA